MIDWTFPLVLITVEIHIPILKTRKYISFHCAGPKIVSIEKHNGTGRVISQVSMVFSETNCGELMLYAQWQGFYSESHYKI